ncbi:MAG: methyl-accepting chemotaxis protein [Deltaproteobacteria bacterium]|nr:methyl-accepting chemotaxis protein [Deltaproteobacteria bacterium]
MLDDVGKKVIKAADDILKEADKTVLATKRTAYTVISIFVLVGIALSLTISLSLIFSVIRSLNALRASVADLAQGEGDLRKRAKMSPVDCSTVMQCGKNDCPSFGKETVCWEESGSYAPVPVCIQITSGTLVSCRECKKIYQNKVYNEITEVLTLLNSFMAKLQGMFGSVTSVVNTLMTAATSVVSSADMVANASQNTKEKTNTVSESATKISSNITSVATVMESVSNNARTVAGAAEEMTSTISEIAQNAERTRTTIDKAAHQSSIASGEVRKLGDAAKEIDQVTVTIDEISEQVKLLALNATIEAARAGEAGKGFAVVAHEIKELARQASKATEDIRKEIEGIQLLTKGAIDQMETVVAAVHEGKEAVTTIAAAVEEQSATTNELANTISEVASGVNQANEHTLRSSTEAAGIAREISDVHHLSVDIVEHSQQLKGDADILTDVARKLQDLVRQFKI